MNPLTQIAQQVADDSIEIVKETASTAVKASADIVSGTVEQLSDKGKNNISQDDKSGEQVSGGIDPNMVKKKEEERKKRYEEVKNELATYIERKRRLEVKIAQEKARELQQKEQTEQIKKKEKEGWLSRLMKRTAGGAHGETDRQKE